MRIGRLGSRGLSGGAAARGWIRERSGEKGDRSEFYEAKGHLDAVAVIEALAGSNLPFHREEEGSRRRIGEDRGVPTRRPELDGYSDRPESAPATSCELANLGGHIEGKGDEVPATLARM